MKDEKNRKKTEALFLSIADISDAYITEAMNYKAAKQKKSGIAWLVAACLAVAVMAYPTFKVISVLSQNTATLHVDALSQMLIEKKNTESYTLSTAESLDLFDGTAKLIWQYSGSAEYCVVKLDSTTFTELTMTVGAGGSPISDSKASDSTQCRVWISNGGGATVTPYLKAKIGNISYGKLVEYEPEIIPGTQVVKLLESAIN